MTITIRIDPDGGTERFDTEPLMTHDFDASDVVTCRAPMLPDNEIFVGIVHDFGALDLEQNPKAWLLYGGSPIWGPMFFGTDSGRPLSDELIAFIESPIDEWGIAHALLTHVRTEQPRPRMFGA